MNTNMLRDRGAQLFMALNIKFLYPYA